MPYRKHYLAATLLFITGSALSAPSGGVVASGQGTISQSGATTTIDQTSSFLGTRFDSFNVGRSENVVVNQPADTSILLVKVRNGGGGQTHIDGALTANGRVFLENPAGIRFGTNAVVNVGGLIASAASGAVENHGSITASGTGAGGVVALQGTRVENSGSINTVDASIYLGSHGGAQHYLDIGPSNLTPVVSNIVNVGGSVSVTLVGTRLVALGGGVIQQEGTGEVYLIGPGGINIEEGARINYGLGFSAYAIEYADRIEDYVPSDINIAGNVRIRSGAASSQTNGSTYLAVNAGGGVINLGSPLDGNGISFISRGRVVNKNFTGSLLTNPNDVFQVVAGNSDNAHNIFYERAGSPYRRERGNVENLEALLAVTEPQAVFEQITAARAETMRAEVGESVKRLAQSADKLMRGSCKKVKTLAGVAC